MSNTKTVMSQAANTLTAPLNVEDVFSTYLYEGTGAAQTITNGIDLAGEGGLVWAKIRNFTSAHGLWDTERGVQKRLSSNTTDAEQTNSNTLTAFNSAGFTLGSDASYNASGYDFTSWTFRKAPKFFDVVTYTGDGTGNRAISHGLNSTPGMVVVRPYDAASDWFVNHRGNGTAGLKLNTTDSTAFAPVLSLDGNLQWDATTVTFKTNFNNSGVQYVAYLFAHNDGDGGFGPDGDADIIKCGSYTGNGSGTAGPTVDLGFEPQWILTKRTDSTGYWTLVDAMRGMVVGGDDKLLYPNTSDAEQQSTRFVPSATGFQVNSTNAYVNASGGTFIYIAIRRGTKVPESADEVFDIDTQNSTSGSPAMKSAFPVDMATLHYTTNTLDKFITSRLTQGKRLETSSTDAEASVSEYQFDYSNGWWVQSGTNSTRISHMWKRAPNYFDVVAYTGDSTSGRTVSHNLGVAPEMMWIKRRAPFSASWCVYHSAIGPTGSLDLDNNGASNAPNAGARFDDTAPTSSVFTVGNFSETNNNTNTYIAYLFASLDGVSKVGSYTGNGSSQTIDCGFTSGARFVLVKRTDSTGGWYIWDTERGIVAGNDPYLELNTSDAEVTSTDWVDPDSSGFIVNGTTINASSAEYIFYAIA